MLQNKIHNSKLSYLTNFDLIARINYSICSKFLVHYIENLVTRVFVIPLPFLKKRKELNIDTAICRRLAADGVFVSKTTGREKFNRVGAISDEEMLSLAIVVERCA